MAKELEALSLSDLLPGSIAGDKTVQAAAQGIDPELQSVSRSIAEALIYSRIDELPEPVLDALAWQWHADFYELARSMEAKREVVKGALLWHRKKGTAWAILKALDMLGVKGTFTPWWKIEGAKPYTFALDAELTDEYWRRSDWNAPVSVVYRAIVESKAARSMMSNLHAHIDREADSNIHVGGSVSMGRLQVVRMARPTFGSTTASLTAGAAVSIGRQQTIRMTRSTSGGVQAALRGGLGCSVGIHITFDIC